MRKIFLAGLMVCLVAGVLATILLLGVLYSGSSRGDCGEHPPFAARLSENQAVFLAKVVYVPVAWSPSLGYEPWTIGLVRRRYWGLPWWTPRLVVLGHSAPYLKKGGEYFIDADRSQSRLSVFFPYLEFLCGSRTKPLTDAALELRLLGEGPPKAGVRVIGRALRLSSDGRHYPGGGIRVEISGPNGRVSTVSDQFGIYDVNGLPPGHYTVTSGSVDDADAFFKGYYEMREKDLRNGDVWGRDVFTK